MGPGRGKNVSSARMDLLGSRNKEGWRAGQEGWRDRCIPGNTVFYTHVILNITGSPDEMPLEWSWRELRVAFARAAMFQMGKVI